MVDLFILNSIKNKEVLL